MRDARDERLADVAREQYDVFTLAQALDAGFTSPAARRRVRNGQWEELEPRACRTAVATPPRVRQLQIARTLSTPTRDRRNRAARAAASWRCARAATARRAQSRTQQGARNLWEARVLRFLDRAGVPRSRVNYVVRADGRMRHLDFAWPEHKVFLEFDGFAAHVPRRPFEDDRPRQNALVDKEWAPYRVTKRVLERDSSAAPAPVVRALRRRSTPNTSAMNEPSRNATEAMIA